IPSHVFIYYFYQRDALWKTEILFKKLFHNQNQTIFYTDEIISILMVFLQFPTDYYLAVVRDIQNYSIYTQTSITSNQRCLYINELFNLSILTLPRIERIKYYHLPCQYQKNLRCFYDKIFMCLCAQDNHSNCFEFNRNTTFQCLQN
ncbi:unnamed protein product, partial [Adineta steineri]